MLVLKAVHGAVVRIHTPARSLQCAQVVDEHLVDKLLPDKIKKKFSVTFPLLEPTAMVTPSRSKQQAVKG